MKKQFSGFSLVVFVAVAASFTVCATAAAQGVAVSDTDITIAGDDVLTVGDATPLYIRGTGSNDLFNSRLVKLGSAVLVDDRVTGLTLTILDAGTHAHLSSVNYDTSDADSQSEALATGLAGMTDGQIGILTSYDEFEQHVTPNLRAEARRLGLYQLAGVGNGAGEPDRRHPYAALFYAAGIPNRNQKAVEVLQQNATTAPDAIIATWLIGDGWVGQAVTPADYLRCSGVPGLPGPRYTDCRDGTIVDNHTGLFWLKDASCAALGPNGNGTGTWQEAMDAAAALGEGVCGLSDGSMAGDWRLPKISDLCSAWDGSSPLPCPVAAKSKSLMNTRFVNPPVSDAEGNQQWSEGDAFFGVVDFYYWSMTEAGSPTAWEADFLTGRVNTASKGLDDYIWPVRGGL